MNIFIEPVQVLLYKAPMPPSREEQKAATKEAIIDASKALIIEKGIAETTVREIATKAGVATGSVLTHFESKTDLFYEIFHTDIARFCQHSIATLPADLSLEEKLTHLGSSVMRSYATAPKLYSDFLETSLFARGKWGDKFKAQVVEFGGMVAQVYAIAIAKGEIKKDTNIEAAVGIFFSTYFLTLMGQVQERFTDIDAGVQQFTALIRFHVEGIKP